MAATVAGPEPLIAAKNIEVAIVASAIPPYSEPSISSASANSRCDRPPAPMNTPAAMKKGIAMIGKLSMEVKAICATYSNGRVSAPMIVASADKPRAIAMGTPRINSTMK